MRQPFRSFRPSWRQKEPFSLVSRLIFTKFFDQSINKIVFTKKKVSKLNIHLNWNFYFYFYFNLKFEVNRIENWGKIQKWICKKDEKQIWVLFVIHEMDHIGSIKIILLPVHLHLTVFFFFLIIFCIYRVSGRQCVIF